MRWRGVHFPDRAHQQRAGRDQSVELLEQSAPKILGDLGEGSTLAVCEASSAALGLQLLTENSVLNSEARDHLALLVVELGGHLSPLAFLVAGVGNEEDEEAPP